MIAGQTQGAGDPGAFENRETEARKPINVNLVGS